MEPMEYRGKLTHMLTQAGDYNVVQFDSAWL